MRNILFHSTICWLAALGLNVNAQSPSKINYLNSKPPPADSAVVFAKGVVSVSGRWEEKICFTPDGKEVFFAVNSDGGKDYFRPTLMHARNDNNGWSEPDTAHFSKSRLVGWPILSSNGTILFMEEVVERTKNGGAIGRIAFSEKKNGNWSEINSLTPDVTAKEGFGLAQITNDSTLYFQDRFDRIAYSSKIINGKHSKPEPLSYKINPAVEFFVSPKNDYIIFKPLNWSNQFHISFKEGNDWSMPIPFSAYFSKQKGWDGSKSYGPYVSPDGKYFFFGWNGDIYWVKADFIEVLRKRL